MATLTLTIGALTSTVTTTNTKAQILLTEFVSATGGPVEGTAQQQADHVMSQLKKYLVDRAKEGKRNTLRVASDAANEAEIGALDW
jgi:hypothetical protein